MKKISKYLYSQTMIEKVKKLNKHFNPDVINKPKTFYDKLVEKISKVKNDGHVFFNDKNTFTYNNEHMVDDVKTILEDMKFRKLYSKRHPIHRSVYITTYENKSGMRVVFYRDKKNEIKIRL